MPVEAKGVGVGSASGVEGPVATTSKAKSNRGAESDMHGLIRQCLERSCERAGVKEESLRVVSTSALDDSSFSPKARRCEYCHELFVCGQGVSI